MLKRAVQSSNIGVVLIIIPVEGRGGKRARERGWFGKAGACEVWGWDNYKDSTYVGTLDASFQHTPGATGTRLRPVEATFLGHILGTKPANNIKV